MMTSGDLPLEAVVPFGTWRAGIESAPYRLSPFRCREERSSPLVRLERLARSETDVVTGAGGIVTRAEYVSSRWELRQRPDDSLVAAGALPPVAVPALASFPRVVRLFGSGATVRLEHQGR